MDSPNTENQAQSNAPQSDASEVSKKNEYIESLKTKLDTFGSDLESLKSKAGEARDNAKVELDKEINVVEAHVKEIESRLQEFVSNTNDSWDNLRHNMDSMMHKLGEAFRAARDKLRE